MPNDPFVGRWRLNVDKSQFDPNHRPTEATVVFELNTVGQYLMSAQGRKANGETVTERPQAFAPDGKAYPVPDFPGLIAVATQPDEKTLQAEVRREDGAIVGRGVYAVSLDGQTLTMPPTLGVVSGGGRAVGASRPLQQQGVAEAPASSKVWIGRDAEYEGFLRTVEIERTTGFRIGVTGKTLRSSPPDNVITSFRFDEALGIAVPSEGEGRLRTGHVDLDQLDQLRQAR